MPENVWLLNDSAPVPLTQEFSAASAAAAWGWLGMPAAGEGSEFAAEATPWAYDFSSVSGFYMFTAAEAGAMLAIPVLMRQYRQRLS